MSFDKFWSFSISSYNWVEYNATPNYNVNTQLVLLNLSSLHLIYYQNYQDFTVYTNEKRFKLDLLNKKNNKCFCLTQC